MGIWIRRLLMASPVVPPPPGGSVRSLFASIADRYDLANHLLSAGLDFSWRRRTARLVADARPQRILDVATGSGDLALAVAGTCPEAEITGVDFCRELLDKAQKKGLRNLVVADALNLPFEQDVFDAVTIAFGLRNMDDWDAAVREMNRVLRPGGSLFILDFSLPSPPLRGFYRFYLHRCVPSLAHIITGQKSAYEYLGGSIEAFPSGEQMLQLLARNGFSETGREELSGGVVTVYTGKKS